MTLQFYKIGKSLSQIIWKQGIRGKKITEKYVYLQPSASLSQELYPPTKMLMCMSLLLCFQWLCHNPVELTSYKLNIVRLVELANVSYTNTKLYVVLIIVIVPSPESHPTSPCVCDVFPIYSIANNLAQLNDSARQGDQSAGHAVVRNPSHTYLIVFQYKRVICYLFP